MLYTRFWELKKQYEAGLAEETKKKKKRSYLEKWEHGLF